MRGAAVAVPVALLGLGLVCVPAGAADLKVGDAAPAFALEAPDGSTVTLAQFVGAGESDAEKKGVVLAWFPKAFTKG
ncbi:MAG: hypothetical protein O7G30_16960 [Proteobacteria bacterium]|nr:hypothetical protein [Pseudomonadota bacterium]